MQSKAQNSARVRVKRTGIVSTIIAPVGDVPEQLQIELADAEPLYREIRVVNEFDDSNGNKVKLPRGTKVTVTIEAEIPPSE